MKTIDSEDDGGEDNVEFDVMYDSDCGESCVPESSDESVSDVDVPMAARARKRTHTPTPRKRHAPSTSATSPATNPYSSISAPGAPIASPADRR